MTKLSELTVRSIHRIILKSNSLTDAARQLNVSSATLSRHLGNATYVDDQKTRKPLSFIVLREVWTTEDLGSYYMQSSYDEPLKVFPADLEQKTLHQIHSIVLKERSLTWVAGLLGVSVARLSRYLAKATYEDDNGNRKPLSFTALRDNWPTEEEAYAYWKDSYDKPISMSSVDLQERTLRDIHRIVINSDSASNAAYQLGVDVSTLSRHLAKISYLDEQKRKNPLSFDVLRTKWPDEDSGIKCWGYCYDVPLRLFPVDLQQKTLREIHRVVLDSDTLASAASKLGVRAVTLGNHLARVRYIDQQDQNRPLSFELLQKQWPDEDSGFEFWGDQYNALMNTPSVDPKQISLRVIHRAVINSNTATDVACQLGVLDSSLRRHLHKFTYVNRQGVTTRLSFQALKREWPSEESGKICFGEVYDLPNSESKKRTLQDVSEQYCNGDTIGMDAVADNSASTQCNVDDLNQCIQDGPPSKKYKTSLSFFSNYWSDDLSDLAQPLPPLPGFSSFE